MQSNPIAIPHPSGQTGHFRSHPKSALESRHSKERQPAPTKEEREKDQAERKAKYVAAVASAKLIQQKKAQVEEKKIAAPQAKLVTPAIKKPIQAKEKGAATATIGGKKVILSNPQTISNEITKKTSSKL
jgi:hypothetical protein